MIVNVEARDLGLGSGGFDVVHVNLTRGLDGPGAGEAAAMKLNYTSLQHPVEPVEVTLSDPADPKATAPCPGSLAPRAAGACGLGGRQALAPDAGRLRPDRGRRPAGRASRRTSPSCVAQGCSAATSPPPGVRRRARGDHRHRCTRGRRGTRLGRRDRGPGPGIVGSESRSGTAEWRRWTARTPRSLSVSRPARAADVERRPARARHPVSHHTPPCCGCCSEPCRCRCRPASRCRSPCSPLLLAGATACSKRRSILMATRRVGYPPARWAVG